MGQIMSQIIVYVPLDSSAVSVGANEVADKVSQTLPQCQLIRNGSHGALWLEPLVEVEADGKRHAFANMSEADVESILQTDAVNTSHSNYVGLTADLDFFKPQTRMVFDKCGWIDPFDYDAWCARGGSTGVKNAIQMQPQAVVDAVKASGLRGRGGAAFPTGIKWQTVLDATAEQKYIVCNADEGDSGTYADRMLMEGDPLTLIEGMVISGLAVGSTKGFIYIRSEYPIAIDCMRKALDVAYQNQLLGANVLDSGKSFDLEIREGAGAYICGEETSLLESLEGAQGTIRYKPPLPALEGLLGKPTVVNNVISLASCPYILSHPGEFEQVGYERSKGTLTVQLCGNVRRGGLYEMPFGFNLKTLVEDIGGGTLSGKKVRTMQVGGPLGAYLNESEFGLTCDYETYGQHKLMLGHGGVVVFDESVDMSEQAKFAMKFCADESCGKCTPCRIGSVRGVELISAMQKGDQVSKHKLVLEELCDTMLNTSLCAMGGLTPMPVMSALEKFATDFDGKK